MCLTARQCCLPPNEMSIEDQQPEKALPLLKRALEINPDYTNAILHMADAQSAPGDRKSAKFYLDRAIKTNPDDLPLRIQKLMLDCSI